jgi:nitrite reductase/ring-hydroxylating ferredoxin subunit
MRTSVVIGEDRGLARRLARLDDEFGLRWVSASGADSVDLVVVDLAAAGAIDEVRQARRRWPAAIIAGYLTMPDPEAWIAGQRAGCDLVANRGALTARLRPLLAGAQTGRRTFPVLDEADLGGRLGLVARVENTPLGPVAIYQIDGAVHAVADRCPHAGAPLSEGQLNGRHITCPWHGSQFDVCTGERTRGPADSDIATFPVAIADGQVGIIVEGTVE